MKTIEEAIQAASTCLKESGIDNPRLEAEFLIAAFLQVPRTHLILHRHEAIPSQRVRDLQRWIGERQKRKPLAYVTGEQPFRDLRLKVTPAVLVPRPETELLVEQAFRVLEGLKNPATAVDVGTGSGNIAICLSGHPQIERVFGIDISPAALRVARENARQWQRHAAVAWLEGELLTPVQRRRLRVDLIVANLPYVRTGELKTLEPELHWEPRQALDGGEDGLRAIAPCIEQAADVLRAGGTLLLEIGAEQSRPVTSLLEQKAVWVDVQIFRDWAGIPRIVQSRRKGI